MTNFITAILLILFAAFARLLPHPENFAPVAAAALFAGFYLNKKYALIVPIAAAVLSDIFIGFYPYVLWVYGTYAVIALIGLAMKGSFNNTKGIKKAGIVCGTTVFSSIVFFLITNFGVWTSGLFYEMSFKGLMDSYIAAIPFFRMTILADVVYITVMIGVYELITKFVKAPALQESKISK
ncbi:MAG TPA: DUF6580 family putative transport protein [Ignavibacteria bacterium]|jgi:hypothetical protein